MRRHLYIVLNHGPEERFVSNIDMDKNNYLSFFQSPEGGYWHYDKDNAILSEISVFEDNFDFERFANKRETERQHGHSLDYIVFVFCGHGYTDVNGERCIELLPYETQWSDIRIADLFEACSGSRLLFIDDACLAKYAGQPARKFFSAVNERYDSTLYAETCKNMYNRAVCSCPKNMVTAGYAVTDKEAADGDEYGGYYTFNLLKCARRYINQKRLSEFVEENEIVSFPKIHADSYNDVVTASNGKQHPMISQPRTWCQLPFVVVPNRKTMLND